MAIDVAGTDDYVSRSDALGLSGYGFSVVAWFRPANVTDEHTIWSIGDATVTTSVAAMLTARGATASDPLSAQSRSAGATSSANTSTSFSANAWQHALGMWASTTSRECRLNNAGAGTNTTSRAFGTPNTTSLGVRARSDLDQDMTGQIAEVAVINKIITESEIAAHFAGERAGDIWLPSELVAWWPLWGIHSPEIDLSGNGRTLTLSGSVSLYQPDPPIRTLRFGRAWSFGPIQGTTNATVDITGVSATGAAGDLTATGGALLTLESVEATGAANDFADYVFVYDLTGNAATGAVGDFTFLFDFIFDLGTSVEGTGAAGTLDAFSGITADITGNEATGVANDFSAYLYDMVFALGTSVEATGAAGTLDAEEVVAPTVTPAKTMPLPLNVGSLMIR